MSSDASAPVPSSGRPLAREDVLQTLLPRLREGLYVADADGMFVDGNVALLAMFGVGSLDELRTYALEELLVDAEARRRLLASLDRDGAAHEGELELRRPDGHPCTVLDSVQRAADPATGAARYLGVMLDITKRVELEGQLRELSVRDALTGCFNRRYLAELERQLAEQGTTTWGCVYVDIVDFRAYNERCGHASGDEILVRMSRFLLRQIRATELVVRLGADDFAIVLVGADERRTENVARRLQLAAMRSAPASFGIGWASREGTESFERTLTRAEQTQLRVPVIERTAEANRREG